MAKFRELNLELKSNQKIKLGNGNGPSGDIYFDGENLNIEGPVFFSCGVSAESTSASAPAILTTKEYVDNKFESGCHVYNSVAQTISHAGFNKIEFDTVIYDTYNEYDETTNYRFTATKPGIYMVTGGAAIANVDKGRNIVSIYKNNTSEYIRGTDNKIGVTSYSSPFVTAPVVMAIGDTVDIRIYQSNPTASTKDTNNGQSVYMIVQKIA